MSANVGCTLVNTEVQQTKILVLESPGWWLILALRGKRLEFYCGILGEIFQPWQPCLFMSVITQTSCLHYI